MTVYTTKNCSFCGSPMEREGLERHTSEDKYECLNCGDVEYHSSTHFK